MLPLYTFLNKFKNNDGYVALMSVLVVSAVGTIITISLLVTSLLYQRSSFSLEQGYAASALAKACSNIALEGIRLSPIYDGGESINFGSYRCDILPISKNGNTYNIHTKGIAGLAEKKNKIIVTRIEDPDTFEVGMTIGSWKEVVDF